MRESRTLDDEIVGPGEGLTMGDVDKLIIECRDQIERLELSLPTRLDARDVSLREQLPFYALYCSATLAWRMAELSRDALECFLKGNLASGVVLTRAAMETSAATWTLRRKLAATLTNGKLGEIGNYLKKLRVGQGKDIAEADEPRAIHINDFLKAVEKDCQGFIRHQYDLLSEYAHPNYSGTTMLYSDFDHDGAAVDFGRNIRGGDSTKGIGLTNMNVALLFFEHSFKQVGDLIPEFTNLCDRERTSATDR